LAKIILSGYVLVPDADLAAVTEELPNHIHLTRQEEGCLIFEVSQDAENPNRLNVYEEFSDRVSFEYHQKRVKSSKWGEVSENLIRHYQIRESD